MSEVGLGGGGIGEVWGETSGEEIAATIELALAEGVNFFDVAPSYGDGRAVLVDSPPRKWHCPQVEITRRASRFLAERNTRLTSLVCARSTLPWHTKQSSEIAVNARVLESTAVVWHPAQRSANVLVFQYVSL